MVPKPRIEQKFYQIEQKILKCKKCNLWKNRNNPVIGEGSFTAKILLIGEAPGYNEDLMGRPFVGRAGKLLDEFLYYSKIKRSEIYITNILKCRPKKNRKPKKSEILKCCIYLDKQILNIKPEVIATLGNTATSYILKKFKLKVEKIGKIHGKKYQINSLKLKSRVIPLYHPAAAVYNPNMKKILLEDFKSIKKQFNIK